ncbi:unnamed protein product [Arabis nemorensis]|uniref:RRM domain-containing protein n=1 Tax=Arabis nemorensis TaxID=586526 RepID=A0A565BJG7_9BRAS|nr:unnamed protein product [Arabis nemorensis]
MDAYALSSTLNFLFRSRCKSFPCSTYCEQQGEPVGCGFIEFASANEAKKALEKRNGGCNWKIFLDVVKTSPFPLRPKYNLVEKLWYEDYLRRFGEDYLDTKPKPKKPKIDKFCACDFGYDLIGSVSAV